MLYVQIEDVEVVEAIEIELTQEELAWVGGGTGHVDLL